MKCSGAYGHYGFQAARAVELVYSDTANNFIGNVVGSVQMQTMKGYNSPVAQKQSIEYPAERSYDAVAYGWSFGYGSTSDEGAGTGCGGGEPPCHHSGTSTKQFLHGNYNNIGASTAWAAGVTHELPASFYLGTRDVYKRQGILGVGDGGHRAIVVRHDRCVDDVPLDPRTPTEC